MGLAGGRALGLAGGGSGGTLGLAGGGSHRALCLGRRGDLRPVGLRQRGDSRAADVVDRARNGGDLGAMTGGAGGSPGQDGRRRQDRDRDRQSGR